jgi:hypothetical protein
MGRSELSAVLRQQEVLPEDWKKKLDDQLADISITVDKLHASLSSQLATVAPKGAELSVELTEDQKKLQAKLAEDQKKLQSERTQIDQQQKEYQAQILKKIAKERATICFLTLQPGDGLELKQHRHDLEELQDMLDATPVSVKITAYGNMIVDLNIQLEDARIANDSRKVELLQAQCDEVMAQLNQAVLSASAGGN